MKITSVPTGGRSGVCSFVFIKVYKNRVDARIGLVGLSWVELDWLGLDSFGWIGLD